MTDCDQSTSVAALPTEYGTTELNQLFNAGYEAWCVDGETDPDMLIQAIEDVGLCAVSGDPENPESLVDIVGDPEALAVASSLAGICLCSIDRFSETRQSSIQPWVVLREQYAETMAAMVDIHDTEGLKREIAEVLLGKPQAEHVQSHGGPTVTATVMDPLGGQGEYLEVPLTAASTDCLVGLPGEENSGERSGPGTQGDRTLVRDNRLLVPADVLTDRYRTYLSRQGFQALQDAQEEILTDEQRGWVTDNVTAIEDAVDRLAEQGHHERLWTHVHAGDGVVTALQRSIDAASGEDAPEFGEPATAGDLYETLEGYTPDEPWIRAVSRRIESSYSLAQRLTRYEDHPQLEVRDGEVQREYVIRGSGGNSESLTVEHPEDFLQLPCYQKLDDRLQEKGPTRKELWDLVRKTAWLPQYRSNGSPDVERILSDIKELFSRWPWYDPQITEQQVRYELRPDAGDQRLNGTEPLPMGCDNPDMQQYCIGKDQCEYSIYGSLPFAESLYTTLDRMDGT